MFLAVIGGLCKESGFCVLFQLAVGELLGAQPLQAVGLLSVFGGVFFGRSWLTQGTSAGFSYVDTPVQYHSDSAVRIFTYLYFHAKYAQLLVLPWSLSWDYSYDSLPLLFGTWRDPRVLLILSVYLGVASIACWGFSVRSRRVVFGLSNVLVPFVPASNLFFIVGVTVGERLLYPCSVGVAILLSAWGEGAGCHWQPAGYPTRARRTKRLRFFIGLVLLTMYMYRCAVRVYQWQSCEHLFTADAISYPRSAKALHQLGTVLHKQERWDEALSAFRTSLSIFKQNALTEYCIAQILLQNSRAEEAKVHFESILSGHGMGFGSHNLFALYADYGFALLMLGRFQDALPPLTQGLKMNEDLPYALNALGYSLAHLGRNEEAVTAFQRGIRYDPTNPYLTNNLGVTLLVNGQVDLGADLVAKAMVADSSVQAFVNNMQNLQEISKGNRIQRPFSLELFYDKGP